MYYDGPFIPYVSVAERRRRAQREIARIKKTGREPSPVVIEGRQIANTFWGKGWCDHLASYSDIASRLPRGRSYVRNGAVVDLQIARGEITALVMGSAIYNIRIQIRPLDEKRWHRIVDTCSGGIDSVVELLSGKLSDSVMSILCRLDSGLFPSSAEIHLSCDCPDGAYLCKHLAAVLYGVGARLDEQPELLFVLRGVDEMDLITKASDAERLQGSATGENVLDGATLGDIFGLELADDPTKAVTATPVKATKDRRPKRARRQSRKRDRPTRRRRATRKS